MSTGRSNPWKKKSVVAPVNAGEPAQIIITRDHAYKKDSTRGCLHCRGKKYAPQHLGHSESVNGMLGAHYSKFQAMFDGWSIALTIALEQSGLPRGCRHIFVEGVMCFPQRYANGPDQGNHRFIVEKALGDALQGNRLPQGSEPWLDDDHWERYEFGGLSYQLTPKVSQTKLLLFAS